MEMPEPEHDRFDDQNEQEYEQERERDLIAVERRHPAVEGPGTSIIKFNQFINYVFVLIEGVIGLRILLKALGGNPANAFVDFIYAVTAPLVGPFLSVFNWGTVDISIGVIEFGSILAIAFYILLNYAIVKLIWILVSRR